MCCEVALHTNQLTDTRVVGSFIYLDAFFRIRVSEDEAQVLLRHVERQAERPPVVVLDIAEVVYRVGLLIVVVSHERELMPSAVVLLSRLVGGVVELSATGRVVHLPKAVSLCLMRLHAFVQGINQSVVERFTLCVPCLPGITRMSLNVGADELRLVRPYEVMSLAVGRSLSVGDGVLTRWVGVLLHLLGSARCREVQHGNRLSLVEIVLSGDGG